MGARNTERVRHMSPDDVWSALCALLACRWVWWVPSMEDAWTKVLRSLEVDARTRIVAPFGVSRDFAETARAIGAAVIEVDLDADTGRPRWQAFPRASDGERPPRDIYIVDHRFGFPCPIPHVDPAAAIIEDATGAVGGTVDGHAVGSLADAAVVALGHLPFAHSRGALVALRETTAADRLTSPFPSEMDQLIALGADVDGLHNWVEGCRAAARVYDSAWRLANLPLRPILPAPGTAPTYASYLVLVDDPEALAQALDRDGIETRRPLDAGVNSSPRWPGACEFSRRALALPCHPDLDLEDLLYVASAVRAAVTLDGSSAMEGMRAQEPNSPTPSSR
jgi:dTDP-4-amino-4,6-dideoxygalactose transaminase